MECEGKHLDQHKQEIMEYVFYNWGSSIASFEMIEPIYQKIVANQPKACFKMMEKCIELHKK